MKKTYLEDIGTLEKTEAENGAESYIKLWKLKDLKSIDTAIVVENTPGKKFLLSRGMFGADKFCLIKRTAWNLFRFTHSLITKAVPELSREEIGKSQKVRQFLILSGAYPLDMQDAWQRYLECFLQTSRTDLTRKIDKGDKEKSWSIEERIPPASISGKVWLIPDTAVASGSTISYFLRTNLERAKKSSEGQTLRKVFLYTACGSLMGANKAAKICKDFGVGFIPVFSQAIFEVSPEGNLPNLPYTDLPILNEGTITSKKFHSKAKKVYQDKPMCSIGDVGDSISEVEQYLIDTLREVAELEIDPTKQQWRWVREIWQKEKIRNQLQKEDPKASNYFKESL